MLNNLAQDTSSETTVQEQNELTDQEKQNSVAPNVVINAENQQKEGESYKSTVGQTPPPNMNVSGNFDKGQVLADNKSGRNIVFIVGLILMIISIVLAVANILLNNYV